MPQCPRCQSSSVETHPFRWNDVLVALLLLRPFKCGNCGFRFIGFRWSGRLPGRRVVPIQNRRAWVRHTCDRDAKARIATQDSLCLFPTRIKDISRGGVKLISAEAFTKGTLLHVQMERANQEGHAAFVVEVMHCGEVAEERSWALGCRFTRLIGETTLSDLTA